MKQYNSIDKSKMRLQDCAVVNNYNTQKNIVSYSKKLKNDVELSYPATAAILVNTKPDVSVVVPVFNEEEAVASLVREIDVAFQDTAFEVIFVDDGSQDRTRHVLYSLKSECPRLRILTHDRNAGQSSALRTGVTAARGPLIVTLDGDGQNDPADALRLVRHMVDAPPTLGLIGGRRISRQDNFAKRCGSRVANGVRMLFLQDGADDTGCGLKVFRKDLFLRLPYFDHMHRFLPALMIREGYHVAFEAVGHRPRTTGTSKYNNFGRLKASILDLIGVMWLLARSRDPGSRSEL